VPHPYRKPENWVKVGSLNRFIILRADSSLELMPDTQTEHDSGEDADRSSSVSMEDLAWSRRVRGSLRSCGLRRDRRFETAPLGREEPPWRNQARASWDVTLATAWTNSVFSVSTVRAAADLKKVLILDQHGSLGEKSGD
jgi:hypothetical protein